MGPEEATIETLRRWSQILLWVSIVLPILAALAVGARYYIEQYEKRLSSRITSAAIQEAKRDAAEAQTELSNLKSKMAPRRLTAEQRSRMLEALRKGESRLSTKRFAIWWPSHSPEPEQFGRGIWNVLAAAGWTVFPVITDLWFFTPVPVGVKIEATSSASDTAEVLYEALQAAGIEYGGGELRETGSKLLPDDVVLLKIGVKPTNDSGSTIVAK